MEIQANIDLIRSIIKDEDRKKRDNFRKNLEKTILETGSLEKGWCHKSKECIDAGQSGRWCIHYTAKELLKRLDAEERFL